MWQHIRATPASNPLDVLNSANNPLTPVPATTRYRDAASRRSRDKAIPDTRAGFTSKRLFENPPALYDYSSDEKAERQKQYDAAYRRKRQDRIIAEMLAEQEAYMRSLSRAS